MENLVNISAFKLASGSWDRLIKIWDLITGEYIMNFTGHTNAIRCLVKINDFQIVSGSKDNSIRIRDI